MYLHEPRVKFVFVDTSIFMFVVFLRVFVFVFVYTVLLGICIFNFSYKKNKSGGVLIMRVIFFGIVWHVVVYPK